MSVGLFHPLKIFGRKRARLCGRRSIPGLRESSARGGALLQPGAHFLVPTQRAEPRGGLSVTFTSSNSFLKCTLFPESRNKKGSGKGRTAGPLPLRALRCRLPGRRVPRGCFNALRTRGALRKRAPADLASGTWVQPSAFQRGGRLPAPAEPPGTGKRRLGSGAETSEAGLSSGRGGGSLDTFIAGYLNGVPSDIYKARRFVTEIQLHCDCPIKAHITYTLQGVCQTSIKVRTGDDGRGDALTLGDGSRLAPPRDGSRRPLPLHRSRGARVLLAPPRPR